MKTGFDDLDNIVKLKSPQLILCVSSDYIIGDFLLNIVKNISIIQKESSLYIDNNLIRDCSENIKKERKIIFENKKYEMEILPMLIEVSDYIIDDIISSMTMLNRTKLLDNRIVESVLTQKEIIKLSKNNKIDLIEIVDGKKFIKTVELFNKEEKDKLKEADFKIKSAPLFLEHKERLSLEDLKELCCKYKKEKNIKCIFLNNIDIINNYNQQEILKELQDLSKKLDINLFIGKSIFNEDEISLENLIKNLEVQEKYTDTILYLKDGVRFDRNILHIWIMKSINKKLGKIELIYLEEYDKYINLEKIK